MNRERWKRWLAVVLFATAMAWVEAAVVFYLRLIAGHMDPYQARPLPEIPGLQLTEVFREAATMMMLACVGWIAGKTWRGRLAYLLIAFGTWDIFYYVFLKVLTGWPRTLLDWDILFLIPLPWWGPVLTPTAVAALMVLFGTLCTSDERPLWPSRRSIGLSILGVGLLLWAFMFDPIRLLCRGADFATIRDWLPKSFPWGLFSIGLGLASVPSFELALQLIARSGLTNNSREKIT